MPRHALSAAGTRRPAVLLFAIALLACLFAPAPAGAQAPVVAKAVIDTAPMKRSGPRYGAIWLSKGIVDSIHAKYPKQQIHSTTAIFGWDFQTQLMRNPGGITPVTDLVLGVAGLDQGLVLPSATWLVGLRSTDDFELGIGPNVSVAGVAFALTVGKTFHSGDLHVPIDIAWVSSSIGTRMSITSGFNIMK